MALFDNLLNFLKPKNKTKDDLARPINDWLKHYNTVTDQPIQSAQEIANNPILKIVRDAEVAQCLMRVKDQAISIGFSISQDGTKLKKKHNYIEELVSKHLETLIMLSINAWLYGNKTYEITYAKDSNQFLIPVKLTPIGHGLISKDLNTDLLKFNNIILSPLVYRMIVSHDLEGAPMGDGLINQLDSLICNKINANDYYMRLLRTFGKPDIYVSGNLQDADKERIINQLISPNASVFTLPENGKATPINYNVDYEAFRAFKSDVETSIQKLILGQTLTSDIKGAGSYAAASVHKQVADEKIQAFCTFTASTVNDFIKTFLTVNKIDLNVTFQFKEIVNIQKERADRDKILFETVPGLTLSKDYLIKTYGFEETDLDINNDTENSPNAIAPTLQADIPEEGKQTLSHVQLAKSTTKIDTQEKIDELARLAIDNHSDDFLIMIQQEALKASDEQDFINRLQKQIKQQKNTYEDLQDAMQASLIYGYCNAEDCKIL